MSNLLIETQKLNFGFKKNNLIIKDINLQVEQGTIYGFLGPNGAGKTTTIRLLMGLLTPQHGEIKICGKSLTHNSIEIFSDIGTLIESPSLYQHLTGFDNLEITRKIKNVPKARVDEVLQVVKLSKAAKAKVKSYSMGMKQRLGVAIALLSKPKLLILDEPTNGLDPKGMIDMRELLFNLSRDFGTTILVSSHLLSEIEKIATHLGIIHNGSLKYQGTMQELEKLNQKKSYILLETNNPHKAISFLQDQYRIKLNDEDMLEIDFQTKEQVDAICKKIISEGLNIYQVQIITHSLEKTFLELTTN
ncbi:MAG TPA: ATP-binding cassette domain-containing protein [Chitinophagaceae bacterium]|nr:ATP-binding cassette domain-containing protein [Chitinophagaceae bacterium]